MLGEGLIEGDSDVLGDRLALGEGETDDDPALGEGLSLELGERDRLALLDGLSDELGLTLGDSLAEGD